MSRLAFRIRPLGVGDLLDEMISLYRRHFLLLIGIGAVLLVPLAVLQLLYQLALFFGDYLWLVGAISLLYSVVFLVAYLAILLATTHAVSEIYLGRRPKVRGAYAAGMRRFGGALVLSLLVSLALILMAVTIVGIPAAIYFGVSWLLAPQVLLLEDLGVRKAVGRSRALVSGSWWRVAGIGVLIFLLEAVIQMVFSLPQTILQGVAVLSDPSGMGLAVATVLGVLIGTASQVIAGPIWFCGLVLLYYDLRVRREGFDLELRAREMGAEADATPVME